MKTPSLRRKFRDLQRLLGRLKLNLDRMDGQEGIRILGLICSDRYRWRCIWMIWRHECVNERCSKRLCVKLWTMPKLTKTGYSRLFWKRAKQWLRILTTLTSTTWPTSSLWNFKRKQDTFHEALHKLKSTQSDLNSGLKAKQKQPTAIYA